MGSNFNHSSYWTQYFENTIGAVLIGEAYKIKQKAHLRRFIILSPGKHTYADLVFLYILILDE